LCIGCSRFWERELLHFDLIFSTLGAWYIQTCGTPRQSYFFQSPLFWGVFSAVVFGRPSRNIRPRPVAIALLFSAVLISAITPQPNKAQLLFRLCPLPKLGPNCSIARLCSMNDHSNCDLHSTSWGVQFV